MEEEERGKRKRRSNRKRKKEGKRESGERVWRKELTHGCLHIGGGSSLFSTLDDS